MENVSLYYGNCLEVMPKLDAKSVDMVLCDLPYGTTTCKWDQVIPFNALWEQYNRVIKDNSAVVLFGQEPFSSVLRSSNLQRYKYNWVWQKLNAPNYLNKRCMPGKIAENICMFSNGGCSPNSRLKMKYYPVVQSGKPYKCTQKGIQGQCAVRSSNVNRVAILNNGTRLPNNILKYGVDKDKFHPCQKPVALLEYLIKTYTQPGDLVLDNCIGSGSTGVACMNTGRRFIGIEKEKEYFEIAKQRIEEAKHGKC